MGFISMSPFMNSNMSSIKKQFRSNTNCFYFIELYVPLEVPLFVQVMLQNLKNSFETLP